MGPNDEKVEKLSLSHITSIFFLLVNINVVFGQISYMKTGTLFTEMFAKHEFEIINSST